MEEEKGIFSVGTFPTDRSATHPKATSEPLLRGHCWGTVLVAW